MTYYSVIVANRPLLASSCDRTCGGVTARLNLIRRSFLASRTKLAMATEVGRAPQQQGDEQDSVFSLLDTLAELASKQQSVPRIAHTTDSIDAMLLRAESDGGNNKVIAVKIPASKPPLGPPPRSNNPLVTSCEGIAFTGANGRPQRRPRAMSEPWGDSGDRLVDILQGFGQAILSPLAASSNATNMLTEFNGLNKSGRIGVYTKSERMEIIRRFKEKRKRRNFKRKVRYDSRKIMADTRVRVNGRFVKAGQNIVVASIKEEGEEETLLTATTTDESLQISASEPVTEPEERDTVPPKRMRRHSIAF